MREKNIVQQCCHIGVNAVVARQTHPCCAEPSGDNAIDSASNRANKGTCDWQLLLILSPGDVITTVLCSLQLTVVMARPGHNEDVEWLGLDACANKRVVGIIRGKRQESGF